MNFLWYYSFCYKNYMKERLHYTVFMVPLFETVIGRCRTFGQQHEWKSMIGFSICLSWFSISLITKSSTSFLKFLTFFTSLSSLLLTSSSLRLSSSSLPLISSTFPSIAARLLLRFLLPLLHLYRIYPKNRENWLLIKTKKFLLQIRYFIFILQLHTLKKEYSYIC